LSRAERYQHLIAGPHIAISTSTIAEAINPVLIMAGKASRLSAVNQAKGFSHNVLMRHALNQIDDQEENNRPERGSDNGPNDAAAQRQTQPQSRKQKRGDEGPGNAEQYIYEQAETRPFHYHSGKPTGDGAHNKRYDE
jgi:hypothetical protein